MIILSSKNRIYFLLENVSFQPMTGLVRFMDTFCFRKKYGKLPFKISVISYLTTQLSVF